MELMERTSTVSRQLGLLRIIAACLALGAVPAAALAQETAGTPAMPANQGGPMVIEQEHLRMAVAPEFRVSKFDGSTAQLAGAYGGWLVGRSLLVGGGIYSLTNGSRTRGLTYGGAVVGWQPWSVGRLGLSVRGLFGVGRATVADTVSFADVEGPDLDRSGRVSAARGLPSTVTVARSTDLVIGEPQIDLVLRLTKHLHLDVGGGYRLVGASHNSGISDGRFRGASGSIALRIGSAQ
jgi:hypothetical protein